jgi:hypothetical protein
LDLSVYDSLYSTQKMFVPSYFGAIFPVVLRSRL